MLRMQNSYQVLISRWLCSWSELEKERNPGDASGPECQVVSVMVRDSEVDM